MKHIALMIFAAALFIITPARAADEAPAVNAATDAAATDLVELTLAIKHHAFEPATLTAPAGKRIKIIIDNQDPTAEQFDSPDLGHEKVVEGNSQGELMLTPLNPGTYNFIGKLHDDTATGTLVVK
jgi:plastocyanin